MERIQTPKINWYEACCILIGTAAFIYTCIRAYDLSITHDEALTYLVHAQNSVKGILMQGGRYPANNHLLNTLLIRLFSGFFGSSELIIRLPALLGHILYLIAAFGTLKLFLKGKKLVAGFALMASNPFLLDLFSCGRGYALGLGFMLASIYCLFVGKNVRSVIMATLSVFSVAAFFPAYTAIVVLIVALSFRWNRPKILLPVILSALCLSLAYNASIAKKILIDAKGVGGTGGVWQDTVMSLLNCVLSYKGSESPALLAMAGALIAVSFILALVAVFYVIKRRGASEPCDRYLVSAFALLGIIFLVIETQSFLFKVRYPTDRTAVYLIPLYLILVLLLWDHVRFIKRERLKKALNAVCYLLLIGLMIDGVFSLNLAYFYLWRYDASTKIAMQKLREITVVKTLPDRQYKLGVSWTFEPSVKFYIVKDNIRCIAFPDRKGPDGRYDFYYLRDSDVGILTKRHLKLVRSFAVSGSYLAAASE